MSENIPWNESPRRFTQEQIERKERAAIEAVLGGGK